MAECLSAIHCCRVRATRLDPTGVPDAVTDNVYVTDKPLQVQVTPQIEAGKDLTLTGGCDCIVAQYRGYDKLKFFTLEIDLAAVEFGLLSLLIGSASIDEAGEPIGLNWPADQTFSCASAPQPNVALEVWQDAWEDDHQAPTPHRYVHWVFPSSFWQIGGLTLQNDFFQPKLNGFTRGNTQWGEGIFGDYPAALDAAGGFFLTDSIPDAACGFQTIVP